jgi:outer membrane protein
MIPVVRALLACAAVPLLAAADLPMDPITQARTRGSLTLTDSFLVAAGSNERVGIAHEDLNQSRLLRKSATAEVLPQITLEDDYYRQETVDLVPGSSANAFSFADNRNELRVALSQPIFHGLRDRYFLKYTRSNIEASLHGLEEARRALYASVAESFYTALQRQGEIEALEDTVQLGRERYREVQARNEAGLARRTEVLLVKSQLEENESSLTRSRNLLVVARQQLAYWMTVSVDLPLHDDLPLPEPPVPAAGDPAQEGTIQSMIEVAESSRSDLLRQEKEVESARNQVAVARGEHLPTLDLSANAYLDRTNYSTFAQETDWSAELNFTMPLFDGGRTRANVLSMTSKLRQAELSYSELLRQVELDVRNAFLTLQSDLATLITLDASVAAADENYRLVQEEYRSGLATNLEVIAGQNQLLSARLNQEHQKYQVRLDWVTLQLAQGLQPAGPSPLRWVRPAVLSPEPVKP